MRTTILTAVLVWLGPAMAHAQGARLQLDHLDRLADRAAESVNVTIDPETLKLADSFLKGGGDQASLKEAVAGVTGIYVRSLEFAKDDVYTPDDLNLIRKQLTAPGWVRLVSVDSKSDRELVEIYSWRTDGGSGGLAIVVAEPMELTVVNIVGSIDLAKLGALQGSFGIPRLPTQAAPPGR